MLRHLSNFLCLLSLLLCVAATAMWARSHWLADKVWWFDHGYSVHTVSTRGDLVVHLHTPYEWRRVFRRRSFEHWTVDPWSYRIGERVGTPWTFVRVPGVFAYRSGHFGPGTMERIVVLPWPLIAGLAALPPFRALASAARRRRRDRRLGAGLCPVCGYDLTGNVSGTCPECGAKACSTA